MILQARNCKTDMRLLRSHSAVPLAFEQLAAAETLFSHGRALQQDQNFQQQPPDLAGSGGITIIAVLGGCLAAVIFLGVVGVCLNKRFRQQRIVAPDPEAGTAEDSSAAADAEEDAKPKAMDRARSAYLIEGPDGDFACGVRISSFTMHRQRTASLELPATVPETCKGLDLQGSGSAAVASSASSSGELGTASQQSASDADRQRVPSSSDADRQPSPGLSDSSSSSASCDTALGALSRASSGASVDVEAVAAHNAGRSEHPQGCATGRERTSRGPQQPQTEGGTMTEGHAAAQPPEAPADGALTLRQRFSFGFFRPPPPPQDAVVQDV